MPVFSNNAGGGGGGGVPPSGLLEYYVDAATGNDSADGLTWATAWLTCRGTGKNLARLYELYPTQAETRVYLRGTFGPTDGLGDIFPQYGSSLMFGCQLADSIVVKSGTVIAVGEPVPPGPACGLQRVDFGGGLVIAGSDEGKLIVFDDGLGGHVVTYQLIHTDVPGNFARLSIPSSVGLPAWLIAGLPNINARVIDSGANVQAGLFLEGAGGVSSVGFVNLQAGIAFVRGMDNVFLSVDVSAGFVGAILIQSCPNLSRVGEDNYSNIGGFLDALGLCTPLVPGDPPSAMGSKAQQLILNSVAGVSGQPSDPFDPQITGWFDNAMMIGGSPQITASHFGRLLAYGADFATVNNVILGESASGSDPVLGVFAGGMRVKDCSVFGPDPTGIDGPLIAVFGTGTLSLEHTEGYNSGGGGPGNYLGAAAIQGGRLFIEDAFTADSIRGDSGRIWAAFDATVSFNDDCIIGPSVGGIDLLTLGKGKMIFQGNVAKTAVNSSTGGVPGPFLVSIANAEAIHGGFGGGLTFTLPAGTGDYVVDYTGFGALYFGKNCSATLDDLSGGTPVTTGIGCHIRRGSKLVHEGVGLSGVAPIVIGADGLPGGRPWPATSQSDSLYNSNELCLCCPPATGGGAPPPTAYTFSCPVGVAVGDAVYMTGVANTVDKAFMGTVGQTSEAIGIVVALPGPGLCNVVLNGEATAYAPAMLTPGALYYVSNLVAGGITTAPPVAAGEKQQRIGFAATDQILVVETDLTSVLI